MSRPRCLITDAEERERREAMCAAAAARDARKSDVVGRLRELAIDLADRGHVDLARQAIAISQRIAEFDREAA